jgi:anti-sigma factor RsiW
MMDKHLNDGELRAALDGELEASRLPHLETCSACRERQARLQAESQKTARRLVFLAPGEEPVPASRRAWAQFSQEYLIKKEISMFKRFFSIPLARYGTAALLILALILAFPGTRAMAGELLNLFRVLPLRPFPWLC